MDWTKSRTFPKLNSPDTTSRFKDYVVIVTGGCSGIGRATVERFANDGATVYALDIRTQGEDDFKQLYGKQVTCIELDVTDAEKCIAVVADIAGRHNSSIHTLVNSAVYVTLKAIDATYEDWTKSYNVNVIGCGNMARAVLPFMKKGDGCSIVNISSISSRRALPNRWTYSCTKGAVTSLTLCMDADFRDRDIRVNAVVPTVTWSPLVSWVVGEDRSVGEANCRENAAVERFGEVEEVAAVITFLASKDASYIRGTEVPVCGGYLTAC